MSGKAPLAYQPVDRMGDGEGLTAINVPGRNNAPRTARDLMAEESRLVASEIFCMVMLSRCANRLYTYHVFEIIGGKNRMASRSEERITYSADLIICSARNKLYVQLRHLRLYLHVFQPLDNRSL